MITYENECCGCSVPAYPCMGGNRNGQPADIIAVRNESMNEKTGKRREKE